MRDIFGKRELFSIIAAFLVVNLLLIGINEFRRKGFLLDGHQGSISAVQFIEPHGLIATGCSEGIVRLFSSSRGSPIRNLNGHQGSIASISYVESTDEMVTASVDGSLCVWKVPTGVLQHEWKAHEKGLISAFVVDEGKTVVTVGLDRQIRTWSLQDRKMTRESSCAVGVNTASVDSSGTYCVTSGPESQISIHHLKNSSSTRKIAFTGGHIRTIAFSNTATRFAVGTVYGKIFLFDAETGQRICELAGHDDFVTVLDFSPDDLWLVSGANDCTLCFWDLSLNTLHHRLDGHTVAFRSLDISTDARLVSGGYDNVAFLWKKRATMLP